MSVAIKLYRIGKKQSPHYRIVVAEKRSKADGKYLEEIGLYNPMTKPPVININQDRLDYWTTHGAQPTEGMRKLLKQVNKKPAIKKVEKAVKTPKSPKVIKK